MTKELLEFRKNFGLRIKQLSIEKGISQIELAAMVGGRDKQAINRYIKQGANPSAFIVMKIALALNVSVSELFDFGELLNIAFDK